MTDIPDSVITAGITSGWLDTKCCHCDDCNRQVVTIIAGAVIDAWEALPHLPTTHDPIEAAIAASHDVFWESIMNDDATYDQARVAVVRAVSPILYEAGLKRGIELQKIHDCYDVYCAATKAPIAGVERDAES